MCKLTSQGFVIVRTFQQAIEQIVSGVPCLMPWLADGDEAYIMLILCASAMQS